MNKEHTDMVAYWNFYMNDEMITYTRQSYTWMDAAAFAGGNLDTFLYGTVMFFWVYNYGMGRYRILYKLEKTKIRSQGLGDSQKFKSLQLNSMFINILILFYDFKETCKNLLVSIGCTCCRASQTNTKADLKIKKQKSFVFTINDLCSELKNVESHFDLKKILMIRRFEPNKVSFDNPFDVSNSDDNNDQKLQNLFNQQTTFMN